MKETYKTIDYEWLWTASRKRFQVYRANASRSIAQTLPGLSTLKGLAVNYRVSKTRQRAKLLTVLE